MSIPSLDSTVLVSDSDPNNSRISESINAITNYYLPQNQDLPPNFSTPNIPLYPIIQADINNSTSFSQFGTETKPLPETLFPAGTSFINFPNFLPSQQQAILSATDHNSAAIRINSLRSSSIRRIELARLDNPELKLQFNAEFLLKGLIFHPHQSTFSNINFITHPHPFICTEFHYTFNENLRKATGYACFYNPRSCLTYRCPF